MFQYLQCCIGTANFGGLKKALLRDWILLYESATWKRCSCAMIIQTHPKSPKYLLCCSYIPISPNFLVQSPLWMVKIHQVTILVYPLVTWQWKIPNVDVCWENHRTRWGIFQQARFAYRTVSIPIKPMEFSFHSMKKHYWILLNIINPIKSPLNIITKSTKSHLITIKKKKKSPFLLKSHFTKASHHRGQRIGIARSPRMPFSP